MAMASDASIEEGIRRVDGWRRELSGLALQVERNRSAGVALTLLFGYAMLRG
jgi:hypothetical protein